MKLHHLLLVGALVVLATSCARTPDVPPTPAETLMARLTRIQQDGKFAFGHHDDTAYGYTWNNIDIAEGEHQSDTTGRSDVYDVCGDYPGLINWDLGMLELDSTRNLDGVPFDRIRTEIQKQHRRGGLNSISWHPRNPATAGNAWDTRGDHIVGECVTPDGAYRPIMLIWLHRVARFIEMLRDDDGQPIPVIFRPWHEHTGDWFWWGAAYCTPQAYKALWHMTRQVFDEHDIKSVVWCYSPDRIADDADYIKRYPGDAFVDIMGADVYMFGAEEGIDDYLARANRQLSAATHWASERGKLVALSETGSETLPVASWYGEVLLPLCKQYPITYVCVWRNAEPWMKPDHFYAPYDGHPSADSFRTFYADPTTLFCRDVAQY